MRLISTYAGVIYEYPLRYHWNSNGRFLRILRNSGETFHSAGAETVNRSLLLIESRLPL
jgi:hypothetical protein